MFLQLAQAISPPPSPSLVPSGGTLFDLFVSASWIAEFGLCGGTPQQQLFGRPRRALGGAPWRRPGATIPIPEVRSSVAHGEAMYSHPQVDGKDATV